MHNTNVYDVKLIKTGGCLKAVLCLFYAPGQLDYESFSLYLHEQELNYFRSLKYEKRIKDYLTGRYAAKMAVAALTGEQALSSICIQAGIFNQPIIGDNKHNMQVSISHSSDFGIALAFPEAYPMGVDLEQIQIDHTNALETQMTQDELAKVCSWNLSYPAGLTLLWTAKEALSKVLKTGLMTPFSVFEIAKTRCYSNYLISHYKNFTQYEVMSFIIDKHICSIVYPLHTKLSFDICHLQKNFGNI